VGLRRAAHNTVSVTRADFLAAAAAATAAPRPAPPARRVWAAVGLERDGRALLTPFTVTIAMHNATGHVVTLQFPTADLFRVDLLRDDTPVWSSVTGHKPSPITRQLDVSPGLLRLGQVVVDATTDDHRSLAAGKYTLRLAMLGTNFGAVIDTPIAFDPPATIAAVLASRPGQVCTIAGEPYLDGVAPQLRDASGSIRLSRALGIRPFGTYVVRGFVDAVGDERVFDVGRSAPAFENVPSPAP
jgi:hypothetical protein